MITRFLIGAATLAAAMTLAMPAHAADPFKVTTAADTDDAFDDGVCADMLGNCSLRAAITEANRTLGGFDQINFEIPGGGVSVIDLVKPLPAITTLINFFVAGSHNVVVTTSHTDTVTTGFFFAPGSDGSNLDGLVIGNFATAVRIQSGSVTITSSRIGYDSFGNGNSPNTFAGIWDEGPGTAIEKNDICASDVGVLLEGVGTFFSGNVVGCSNAADTPNGTGVVIAGASGVRTTYPYSKGTNSVVGNAGDGIRVAGTSNGCMIDNASIYQNGGDGIRFEDTAANNTVTGVSIHDNAGAGIAVGPGSRKNRFSSLAMKDNGGLGIDLLDAGNVAGVTENDAGDVDTGANDRQNYPVGKAGFATMRLLSGGTIIEAGLYSLPNVMFTIEYYQSQSCDQPSAFGEGEELLAIPSATTGCTQVTTDATGYADISCQLGTPVNTGWFVTALVTGPGGTSEFSQCISLAGPVTTSTTTTTSTSAPTSSTSPTTTSSTSITSTTAVASTTTTGSASSSTTAPTASTTSTSSTTTTMGFCGDGIVQAGEDCDLQTLNGQPFDSCCNETCHYRQSGTVCKLGTVCSNDAKCSGSSGICPQNVAKPSGVVCRPVVGVCDLPETCDGTHAGCPANQFQPSTQLCGPTPRLCEEQAHCTSQSAFCPPNQLLAPSHECRPAAGVCDIPENCNGADPDCPADRYVVPGQSCGNSAQTCQQPTTCTGFDPACPSPQPGPDGDDCTDPSCTAPGKCKDGVCEACFGDAQVAGGAGKVNVVCTLDNKNGDQPAECTGVGHLTGTTQAIARGLDAGGCVAGCPDLAETRVTPRRKVRFDNGKVLGQVEQRSADTRTSLPTNRNGKRYLKKHSTIDMGVCTEVTDHFGNVRRKECIVGVTKPIRKKR